MPGLSASDRQRRFRERQDADQERRGAWLQYIRETNKKHKMTGKRRQVGHVKIMWSSTRLDMNAINWIANRFVVAVEQNICSEEHERDKNKPSTAEQPKQKRKKTLTAKK